MKELMHGNRPMHIEAVTPHASQDRLYSRLLSKNAGLFGYTPFYRTISTHDGKPLHHYIMVHKLALQHPEYQEALEDRGFKLFH